MQAKRLVLAAVAAALLLCAAGWTAYAQRGRAKRGAWTYKAVTASTVQPDEKALNELGAQGWELVGVTEVGGTTFYFFKRPK